MDARPSIVPLLVDVTSQTGVEFSQLPRDEREYFFPDIMGAGVALLDFDQDGRLDLLLLNGIPEETQLNHEDSPEDSPQTAPAGVTRLFRQSAEMQFQDVTSGAGLPTRDYCVGVAAGDVNNDGYPDVFLTTCGQDRLLLNQADGTFRDVTSEAGITDRDWGSSACFCDFDRDGWLDLYVVNYVENEPWRECRGIDSRRDYCQPSDFRAVADRLYRNVTASSTGSSAPDSGGPGSVVRFQDISPAAGISSRAAPGLGVVSADFNRDGWQDFYVANDGEANFLWINGRDGTFRDEAMLRGAAYSGDGRPQASMGIALGDVSQDGAPDLLLTHLGGESNTLYQSAGTLGFLDDSVRSGLSAPGFLLTGFGVCWADLDLDGDLDTAVANGSIRRRDKRTDRLVRPVNSPSLTPFAADYGERNQLFVNLGDGQFQEVSSQSVSYSADAQVSRGLACGDLNNDGRPDLVITNAGGRTCVLLNHTECTGHWLGIRVIEPDLGNRDAYGASVTVRSGDQAWIRWANPAGSYLSSHDTRLWFGLGDLDAVDGIDVLWPDGSREKFPGTKADRLIVLSHGAGIAP